MALLKFYISKIVFQRYISIFENLLSVKFYNERLIDLQMYTNNAGHLKAFCFKVKIRSHAKGT